MAASIGAVNTLIRQPEGGLAGYNTDWDAAISAIEKSLAEAAERMFKIFTFAFLRLYFYVCILRLRLCERLLW